MNCKNSAKNALKVAIFRLKTDKFSGEGAVPPPQTPPPLGRGIPSPQTSLPRRLRRLDSRAFGARPWLPPLQILDPPLPTSVLSQVISWEELLEMIYFVSSEWDVKP